MFITPQNNLDCRNLLPLAEDSYVYLLRTRPRN